MPSYTQAQEEGTAPPVRDESQRLQCRFYEEQFPNPESMVMVKVMNIADMAAEVILLEYNDIEVRALTCRNRNWGSETRTGTAASSRLQAFTSIQTKTTRA